MTPVTITVYGMPGPQGSKAYKGQSKKGHAILVESSKKVKPWRQAVVAACVDAGINGRKLEGPLCLHVWFTLPRPASAPKRVKQPAKKPDLSKLIRSTEDALTDAGVWIDDAQAVVIMAVKTFPGEYPALASPGCVIKIEAAT